MTKRDKKQRKRLETVRVSYATYRHLCDMAFVTGLKTPGAVVDKMVRNMRIEMSDARIAARWNHGKARDL